MSTTVTTNLYNQTNSFLAKHRESIQTGAKVTVATTGAANLAVIVYIAGKALNNKETFTAACTLAFKSISTTPLVSLPIAFAVVFLLAATTLSLPRSGENAQKEYTKLKTTYDHLETQLNGFFNTKEPSAKQEYSTAQQTVTTTNDDIATRRKEVDELSKFLETNETTRTDLFTTIDKKEFINPCHPGSQMYKDLELYHNFVMNPNFSKYEDATRNDMLKIAQEAYNEYNTNTTDKQTNLNTRIETLKAQLTDTENVALDTAKNTYNNLIDEATLQQKEFNKAVVTLNKLRKEMENKGIDINSFQELQTDDQPIPQKV